MTTETGTGTTEHERWGPGETTEEVVELAPGVVLHNPVLERCARRELDAARADLGLPPGCRVRWFTTATPQLQAAYETNGTPWAPFAVPQGAGGFYDPAQSEGDVWVRTRGGQYKAGNIYHELLHAHLRRTGLSRRMTYAQEEQLVQEMVQEHLLPSLYPAGAW